LKIEVFEARFLLSAGARLGVFAFAIVLRPRPTDRRALRAEVRDKFSNLALEAMTL
jgi:hypothetical protein